jgi:hypothetical protein
MMTTQQKQPSLDNYAREACRRSITQLLAVPHAHSPTSKYYSSSTVTSAIYDDDTVIIGSSNDDTAIDNDNSSSDKIHFKRPSIQESVQSATIDIATVSEAVKRELFGVMYSNTSVLPPLLNKLESFFDNSK